MNDGTKFPFEKVALALAAAACLASTVAYLPRGTGELVTRGSAAIKTATAAGGAPDSLASEPTSVPPERPVWRQPVAQTAGPGWVFEVFTPPSVYYNRLAQSFRVTPLEGARVPADAVVAESLTERLGPPPIQLSAYFGRPGEWLVAFISADHAETILARPGDRLGNLGLTLGSFEVRRAATAPDEDPELYEVAGVAILRDDETGRELMLDSRNGRRTEAPREVLRLAANGGPSREAQDGEAISEGQTAYRSAKIKGESPPALATSR